MPQIKFTQGDINEILEKMLAVYTSIYQNVSFKVKLDVEQIKRVFVNILDNALEVIGKEGEIEISTHYSGESKFITIEIADNGADICDEDKQKIFLPIFPKKVREPAWAWPLPTTSSKSTAA